MPAAPSDSPGAIRQKRYRENLKRRQSGVVVPFPSSSSPAGAAATAPTAQGSATLHETSPVTGEGPERFAGPVVLPPANENGTPEPFAPPQAEAPKPPPTPEEVAPMAAALALYFETGTQLLLARHAEELGRVVSVDALRESMPRAKQFVHGAAERVAIKYGIRGIPYQDEMIVVGAIGVATFGFVGKPKKPGDKQQAANGNAERVTRPPPNARNANAQPQPEPGEPVQVPHGDFKL